MAYHCPMCGKEIKDDLKGFTEHVESEIVELIKQDHPDWAQGNGACPRCYEYYKKQLTG